MSKCKLKKFAELGTFENVFQPRPEEYADSGYHLKGNWAPKYFNNKNPIVLELGCGKGEYTLGLAERFPEKNFIGIDIKGQRLWNGGKKALEKNLRNAAFIRIQIENILSFFSPEEISELWITFPDPQPKMHKLKKRLTSPEFLERYKRILSTNGCIHLKTDNVPLFNFTLKVIHQHEHLLIFETHDLYKNPLPVVSEIQTYYEKMFIGKGLSICYCKFKLHQT